MKITNRLDQVSGAASSAGGAHRANGKAAPQSAAPTADRVHLSPLAQQATAVAPEGSSFDAGKVHAIKQAIAEGRMTVDAGAVADKLINQAMALSTKARG
jgi:negative regulator of flagellin synthesis FlgM